MFSIDFTDTASDDLLWFREREQRIITDTIEVQLTHQPNVQRRNRKRLRPNQVAEWELRIQEYRVFYNVNAVTETVEVQAVVLKIGSKLMAQGREFQL